MNIAPAAGELAKFFGPGVNDEAPIAAKVSSAGGDLRGRCSIKQKQHTK